MATNFLAGKAGYVKVGATSYSFGKWSFACKAGLVKVTNFNSGGQRQQVVGIIEGTLQMEGPYDQGNMPFVVGTGYTWILGYTTGIQITIYAIIESVEPAVDAEGAATLKITAQSDASTPFATNII